MPGSIFYIRSHMTKPLIINEKYSRHCHQLAALDLFSKRRELESRDWLAHAESPCGCPPYPKTFRAANRNPSSPKTEIFSTYCV